MAVGLVPIARRAIMAALAGTPFSIEMLMTIAAVGAVIINATEEAAAVVFLFLVGELLEGVAAGKARDSIRSHENFKLKQNLPFDLLSDSEEILCNQFSVIKEKKLYGKLVRGIERSTFVIDGQGVLRKEWRGVKAPGHAQEVLDFIKTL